MTRVTAVERKRIRRDVMARLERKREAIFAAMHPDDREFFKHYDVGTLIALVRSDRLVLLDEYDHRG